MERLGLALRNASAAFKNQSIMLKELAEAFEGLEGFESSVEILKAAVAPAPAAAPADAMTEKTAGKKRRAPKDKDEPKRPLSAVRYIRMLCLHSNNTKSTLPIQYRLTILITVFDFLSRKPRWSYIVVEGRPEYPYCCDD